MSTLASHLNKTFGYTCQTWLSTSIADRYFGGSYRIWFASTLNPLNNGDSSNPMKLYRDLTIIVNTNDFNNSRIGQLRQRLTTWIWGSALSSADISLLISEIASAPIPAFRPQLWRIDLSLIHISRLINLGQFPDEYLIRDLIAHELEVIAE